MIEANELKSDYIVVHGDPRLLQGRMQVGDFHRHIGGGGDTTAPARIVMQELSEQGVDLIMLTNHNDVSAYDRVSRMRDHIDRRGGHHVEIGRGVEVTARSHFATEEDRHLLVYQAGTPVNFGELRVFDPLDTLVEAAANLGAVVSLPHIELGVGMSVTEREAIDLKNKGLPFLIEVYNGGAGQIDAWRPKIEAYSGNPIVSFLLEKKIPKAGSNKLALDISEILATGATGGTDLHGRGRSFVLTCVPEGENFLDAIQKENSVVVVQKSVPRPTVSNLAIGTFRGEFSGHSMQRKVQRYGEIFVRTR